MFSAVGILIMMAIVALAQYLVGGKVSTGAIVAISVPTGMLLGSSFATGRKR